MGWNCERKAGEVMDRFLDLHDKTDGLIHRRGQKFFFEVETGEGYEDGRVKMLFWELVEPRRAKRIGSFYILPGGRIPKFASKLLSKFRKEVK